MAAEERPLPTVDDLRQLKAEEQTLAQELAELAEARYLLSRLIKAARIFLDEPRP